MAQHGGMRTLKRLVVLLALALLAFGGQARAQTANELKEAAHGYYAQGKYAEAISLLERSLQSEQSADSYFGLGLCYLNAGSLDKARKNFSRAARMNAIYLPAMHSLASLYMEPDGAHFNIDAAKDVLEEARGLAPDDSTTLSKLAEIYFLKSSIGIDSSQEEMGRYRDLAETVLLQLLDMNPGNSRAHMLLGQIHGTRGQLNSAILEFQKAVKANPKNYEAWLSLGMDYYRIGLFKEAAQAFRTAGNSENEDLRQASGKYLQEIERLQSRPP